MTEPGEGPDPDALEARLPAGWVVERLDDGAAIGRIEGDRAGDGGPAFLVVPGGPLWRAFWLDPVGAVDGRAEAVQGMPERCHEWVVKRAGGRG